MNLAIDKDALRRLRGGPSLGEIAGHAIVGTLLTVDGKDLLADFDPYATPNSQGDINAAKEEMKQSKYDTDQDGTCDAPECKDVLSVTDEADPYPGQAASIQDDLDALGMTLNVKSFERTTMYTKCNDPNSKTAFCLGPGWFKDYPDGSTWAPLFDSTGVFPSCCNYSLVGASPKTLSDAGYSVTSVPSADPEADECTPLTGDERIQCWADYDKFIMEEIVPWVPYIFDNNIDITSTRITNYTFDSFASIISLDHVGLQGGGA